MKKLLIAALFAVAMPVLAAEKDFKKETIAIPAADLKWEQPWGPQGPFVATVGDAKKGPCTIFFKLPAGYDSGWHTHDGWYVGTVIKGTATSQGQGDAAPVSLPVGSYFSEPAKRNHKNTCGADSECIIMNFAEKGLTYNPKTAEGKAPPKEPMVKKDEPKKEEPKKP